MSKSDNLWIYIFANMKQTQVNILNVSDRGDALQIGWAVLPGDSSNYMTNSTAEIK